MKIIFKNYDKIKLVIFILLAASFPYYLFINSSLIIAAVLLTFTKLFFIKDSFQYRFNKLSLILFAYYIIETISLLYTQKGNLNIAFFNLEKHLTLVVMPFVFYDFHATKRNVEIIQFIFVITSLIASLVCIIVNMNISIEQHNTYFYDWQFSHLRLVEPIGMHPVYFSMYICFSLLIVMHYLKSNFHKISISMKIIFLLLIFYFLFVITMSGARTLTVSIAAIIIGSLVIYGAMNKSFKLFFYAGLLLTSIVVFVLINPIVKTRFMDMTKNKYETTNYGSYFARTLLWVPGMEIIQENILFGVGIGDAQKELDKKFIQYNYIEGIGMDMHNQYLQILLEVGVVGLFIYISMLCIQLRNSIKQKNLLYLSFLVLFIIGSITESMFCRQNGIIYFLFFSFIFYKSNLNTDIVK